MTFTELQKALDIAYGSIVNQYRQTGQLTLSQLNSIEQLHMDFLTERVKLTGFSRQRVQKNLEQFTEAKMKRVYEELKAIDGTQSIDGIEKSMRKTFNKYNYTYLKVETDMVEKGVRQAKQLENILNQSPDYSITWLTVGDEKVRDEHTELHGLTLPANNDFWRTYGMPGTAPNCRCSFIIQRETIDNSAQYSQGMDDVREEKEKLGLRNPIEDGIIFGPEHNYFKMNS